jgi:hypothetical protein
MKVKKEMLDNINADSGFGRIICCALYLNSKELKNEFGNTIHEQVAEKILSGQFYYDNYDIETIAGEILVDKRIVKDALRDISAMCGARG